MSEIKYGRDDDLEAIADAMLMEDATAEKMTMPDYRRTYGLVQRRELEEISFDPDILVSMVDKGHATKVP